MVEYEFAKDDDGNVININQATPHKKYVCANDECNTNMIPVYGQTGRAYHFRHENINFSHSGETELHYNFKHLLAQRIKNGCIYHLISERTGNYLGKINLNVTDFKVYVEKPVSIEYKPDICIFNEDNNKIMYTVEIVNTHNLDAGASDYINKNDIMCIIIYATHELYNYLSEKSSIELWSDFKGYNFLNFSKINSNLEKEEIERMGRIESLKSELDYKKIDFIIRTEQEKKRIINELEQEDELLNGNIINEKLIYIKLKSEWEEKSKKRSEELKKILFDINELNQKIFILESSASLQNQKRIKQEQFNLLLKQTIPEYNKSHILNKLQTEGWYKCKHDDGRIYEVFIPTEE